MNLLAGTYRLGKNQLYRIYNEGEDTLLEVKYVCKHDNLRINPSADHTYGDVTCIDCAKTALWEFQED
jgi:hypothetical protein